MKQLVPFQYFSKNWEKFSAFLKSQKFYKSVKKFNHKKTEYSFQLPGGSLLLPGEKM